jgi:hypothetical protein
MYVLESRVREATASVRRTLEKPSEGTASRQNLIKQNEK